MSTILHKALRNRFGFDDFRPNQEQIVSALHSGRDVFAMLSTSSGKSLCFQLPCLLREGTGLIITPLISLMHDQVRAARSKGIVATLLTGEQSREEQARVYKELERGRIKLLYVAPERLAVPQFKAIIHKIPIAAVIIDEVHCCSDYGEFRPEYLRIKNNLEGIKAPRACFTATATEQTQKFIIDSIGLTDPFILRGSVNRKNLYYEVKPKAENEYRQIAEYIQEHDGCGIVYRTTRKNVQDTIWRLADYDISCLPYHAGMSDSVRTENQQAFFDGRARVMVATIAFGLGIDKPDIRWILHADLSKNLEGYTQECGRASRDGENGLCTMLYSVRDIPRVRIMIEKTENTLKRMAFLKAFGEVVQYANSKKCRRKILLKYFSENITDTCGACDNCLKKEVRDVCS